MTAVLQTSTTQPSAADLDAVAAEQQARAATVSPVPTPAEIDEAIRLYERAKEAADAAKVGEETARKLVIHLVENFGHVPPHAGQSKRLAGRHNEATITWNTSYSVVESAVADLQFYLTDHQLGDLFSRFFSLETKHKMVEGARDVLKTLSLPNRVHEKIAALVGLAINVKTSAPSLKVKTIQPEKPVRTKKAGKQAA